MQAGLSENLCVSTQKSWMCSALRLRRCYKRKNKFVTLYGRLLGYSLESISIAMPVPASCRFLEGTDVTCWLVLFSIFFYFYLVCCTMMQKQEWLSETTNTCTKFHELKWHWMYIGYISYKLLYVLYVHKQQHERVVLTCPPTETQAIC